MNNSKMMPLPFWVIWFVELWERYGFYGIQSLLVLFLVNKLQFSEAESYILFGTFNAFLYAFVWLGGKVGDTIIGAKRTIILGALFLIVSYISLSIVKSNTIYFALAGIIVGNALFKANPPSLISKLYKDNPDLLDSAMTLYYMAINIGSFIATICTPLISQYYGWGVAFITCGVGIIIGLIGYIGFYNKISAVSTAAGREKINIKNLILTILVSIVSVYVIATLLEHTLISNIIILLTLFVAIAYYILALSKENKESKIKMLVALLLFGEAIIFFVLYNQMPSTLILFVQNNVDHTIFGYEISPAQYYVFNPLTILIFSPILSRIYSKYPATHTTKFCVGMSLCAIAFLILYIPQFITTTGIVSSWWIISTYLFQSIGELLISALGLAMMISLCPKKISGFVSGFWFLSTMLAGPIAGWVGKLTAVNNNIAATESIHTYGNVFGSLGLVVAIIALLMWLIRPYINRLLNG